MIKAVNCLKCPHKMMVCGYRDEYLIIPDDIGNICCPLRKEWIPGKDKKPGIFMFDEDTHKDDYSHNDPIHHPDHYSWRGMECIDFIKAFVRKQVNGFWASCEGNILKYLYRWVRKNKVEDLKKAMEYLDMLIKDVEENGGKE